jgi:hypothetical protein
LEKTQSANAQSLSQTGLAQPLEAGSTHDEVIKMPIQVRITLRKSCRRAVYHQRSYNRQLVPVTRKSDISTNNNCNFSWLPSYYLINTRSLFSKVDELQALLFSNPADIIAITESWLYEDISDDLIALSGYKIYRNDRSHARGGGVCIYLSENIPCQRRLDLENSSFECLWLWLRPERLPYNPPDRSAQEFRDLDEYLVETTDCLRNKYPDCGIVILGDFNNFDLHNLASNHSLKQVVHLPTRGYTGSA